MIKVERINDNDAECVVKGSRIEISAELMMIFKAILMRANDEFERKMHADWLHMIVNIAYKHFDEIKAEVMEPANTDIAEIDDYLKIILGGGTDD